MASFSLAFQLSDFLEKDKYNSNCQYSLHGSILIPMMQPGNTPSTMNCSIHSALGFGFGVFGFVLCVCWGQSGVGGAMAACRISQTRDQTRPRFREAQSLNHRTTRELPVVCFYNICNYFLILGQQST